MTRAIVRPVWMGMTSRPTPMTRRSRKGRFALVVIWLLSPAVCAAVIGACSPTILSSTRLVFNGMLSLELLEDAPEGMKDALTRWNLVGREGPDGRYRSGLLGWQALAATKADAWMADNSSSGHHPMLLREVLLVSYGWPFPCMEGAASAPLRTLTPNKWLAGTPTGSVVMTGFADLATGYPGEPVRVIPLVPRVAPYVGNLMAYALLTAATVFVWRRFQMMFRAKRSACRTCGYDLRALGLSAKCPECGTRVALDSPDDAS